MIVNGIEKGKKIRRIIIVTDNKDCVEISVDEGMIYAHAQDGAHMYTTDEIKDIKLEECKGLRIHMIVEE